MENKENQLMVLPEKILQVATKLNNSVLSVIGRDKIVGFEKAYLVSNAIAELKQLLTPEYMKPIMELQGNKLGFKTDKDSGGGYDEKAVKNCLIEAVLFGLQPTGNQFNIIAGNMYATKEGMGYLLSKIQGLRYDIVPELPRINAQSGAVIMNIEWTLNGVTNSKKIDIPIKVNNYMGADAVLGKATRKARKWLYDTITGSEIPEGDVSDNVTISLKPSFDDLYALFENKKALLDEKELKDAQRIILNKEETSYIKLQKILNSK